MNWRLPLYLITFYVLGCTQSEKPITTLPKEPISIANWNMHIFGITKAKNDSLMHYYADKLSDYDLIIIQEIRDKTGTAFEKLDSLLPEHQSHISSRAGRSNSKEQYGILYREPITITSTKDYNPDPLDRWERPPLRVNGQAHDYSFTLYTIHTKPTKAREEIAALEHIVKDSSNVLIIGDLNADCSYYNNGKETEFDNWHWKILDEDDTTVKTTDCAYDRIIINNEMEEEYHEHGIDSTIHKKASDHYLIWIALTPQEETP